MIILRSTALVSVLFLAEALSPSSKVRTNRPEASVSFPATTATSLATVAMVTLLSTPVAAAEVGEGQVLFQANCAGCHAGGQNFMAEKKTLFKEALDKYRTTDPAKLQDFVQNGMPHKLLPLKISSDSDYASVTTFVLDQALGDKWE